MDTETGKPIDLLERVHAEFEKLMRDRTERATELLLTGVADDPFDAVFIAFEECQKAERERMKALLDEAMQAVSVHRG